MTLLDQPALFDIFNAKIPKEGPKAVPYNLDFSASNSYQINLNQVLTRAQITAIQTVFIDNSVNSVSLTVNVSVTNQNIIVPPYSQGYYPILAPSGVTLTFSCVGGAANTYIYLINVPLPSSVWTKNGTPFIFNGSGYLEVSDPVLDACIANNLVNILGHKVGSGDVNYNDYIGNLVATGSLTNTSATLITGANGYYVTGFSAYLSQQATQAVAGDLVVTLTDSSTGAIYTFSEYVPAAAGGLNVNNAQIRTPPGFFWNNKVAASHLTINFSAALTAGSLKYNINYGITATVG